MLLHHSLYPWLQLIFGPNPSDGTGNSNTSEFDCSFSEAAISTLAAAAAVQGISSSFVLQLSTNQTLASEEKVATPKEDVVSQIGELFRGVQHFLKKKT